MTSKEKTKKLVSNATTDDRNPPSGYLLKELASRTMSISECQTIEDLVIKKLGKSKPYIKYKSLRIVKYLCENGSPNWRRAWQRNTDKLRDAQQFRGPPDPVFGDAPYQQVRKAAKDAMQAVFQQSTIDSSHIKNKIKGIGGGGDSAYSNSSYSGTSTFGSGSRGVYGGTSVHKKDKAPSAPGWDKKPMPGMGNTNYQPAVRTTTFEPLKSSGRYNNPSALTNNKAHSRGKLDTRRSGGKRKKGKAGGVWGGGNDEEEEEEEEEDYSNTYDDEFPSSDRYEKPKTNKRFGGNIHRSKASSGQYEKKWVDDIVKSGGVGCKIVSSDLKKYVSQFENLSQNHVLSYLDEKLEDRQWQKQGKALTLIYALISGNSGEDVIDYFTQSPDNVMALQNAKKSILRKKANSIMEYLDVEEEEDDDEEEEEEEEQVRQTPQRTQPAQTVDLINLTGGVEEEDDMFADMEQRGNNGNKAKQTPDLIPTDMFADMDNSTKVNTATDDIIGIMGNAQQIQSVKKKTDYSFLADLAKEENVTQSNNTGDILNNMGFSNAKPQKTQTQPQQSSNSGGGASAFGFDLGGADNTTQTNTQTQQTQPQSTGNSAFGFDLGGGGGNTAQKPQQSGGNSAFGFDLGGGGNTQQQTTPVQARMSPMQARMSPMMNPMMTNQMMASNMNNMQQMQSMMAQMQQMQMGGNMGQMGQMGQMNQMNMMSLMQNMQQNNSNNNQFSQLMANVNNPNMQQQQQQRQAFVRNDPFAQMMSGTAPQANAVPQRPKKTGPDPFSQFGLNSLK